MVLDIFENILSIFLDAFSFIAAFLSFLLVRRISKVEKEEYVENILKRFFITIFWGLVLFTIAEISWDLINFFSGYEGYGFPDIFYMVGTLLFIIAFTSFSIKMYIQHKKLVQGVLYTSTVTLIFSALTYFLISNFGDISQDGSFLELFLNYFYPIADTLLIISSASIYFFFKSMKKLAKPLFLMALSQFFLFSGDVVFTYFSFNNLIETFLSVIYDSIYAINYLLYIIAFYILLKKWVGVTSIKQEISELFIRKNIKAEEIKK